MAALPLVVFMILCVASVDKTCNLPEEPDYPEPTVQTEVIIKAAAKGDLKKIHLMEKKGYPMDERNGEGETALMVAAGKGEFVIARFLVRVGCDLEKKDRLGRTAVMHAAIRGETTTVDVLIDLGANVLEQDSDGSTALLLSTKHNHSETTSVLLSTPDPPVLTPDKYGWYPIHYAARNGDIDSLREMTDLGAADVLTGAGRSVMAEAAGGGWVDIVKYLTSHGVGGEAVKDSDGQTPAMRAVLGCHCDILPLLNPDLLSQTDNDGRTVLHHAAHRGCESCFTHIPLTDSTPDRHGLTPAYLAASSLSLETIKAVPSPDFNTRHPETLVTPLMIAVKSGKPRIVTYLIENGAEVNARDHEGLTALGHAVRRKMKACEKAVRDAGGVE
eukprot:TRINITY_DN40309_c0_g1_i1.p1 TRINITY_DN40309_c0_g1~~TRINITY_DN40309_c0_g1_i1.p1  ORF type:complete len:421 (+),score=42.17 TRINITY_DN40309_c0_g1_i1:104-1264(+)